jgi:3',5'-cyclic-AMP phosphodiesterase
MPIETSRRSFLRNLALGGAGAALGANGLGVPRIGDDADFSFVHLTDMHVRRKRRGHQGYAACASSVNALERPPDLVLMGGDMAFDGLYNEKDEFIDQIELFTSTSNRLDMPWHPCLGNHDILGWNSRRKVAVDDPDIGKTLMMRATSMPREYYSFDAEGWHFVVLDTMLGVETESGPGYVPRLGEEQLEWLRFDLGANHSVPTVVVMHIAAFCNMGQINGDPAALAMSHMVVQDNRALREILERHNVKAVLQGHSHQVEDFFWNGIWYVTSQSVSAAWWGGNWRGFNPGYTQFFAKDGALSWVRHEFDWEHHLEPEDDLERERIAEREKYLAEQARLRREEIAVAVDR